MKNTGFNRYEPPSPSLYGDELLEETFLKDVDQIHDRLPQPFRKIDKIICDIFEQSWLIVEKNEEERIHKKSRKRDLHKVLYEEELVLLSKIYSIIAGRNYCTLACKTGLLVYEIPSLLKIAFYEHCEETNGSFVKHIFLISQCDDVLVFAGVDSKGLVNIYGFKTDKFYFIQHLENKCGGETPVADKVTVADDGSYIAVSWKDSSNQWLDVYKLPVSQWMSYFEKIHHSRSTDLESNHEEISSQNSSTTATFAECQIVLRVNPQTIKPNTNTDISSNLKNFDVECNTIASGTRHILSANFFEHLHNEFNIKANWKEDDDLYKRQPTVATVHYLKGQMTSSLFPSRISTDEDGLYNAIAVCWKDSNQVCIYPLQNMKDVEEEPMSILPHANKIVWSAVNSQTDLIAVSLVTNCISVWNRYIGQPLKAFMSEEKECITMLRLSSVYHGTLQTRLTYATSSGKLFQMTCERHDMTKPVLLDNRSSSMLAHDQVIKVINGPMNLMTIIWQSGHIIVYNEASSQPLCQLDLLGEENEKDVRENVLKISYSKSYIFAVRDESQDSTVVSRLFLFEPDIHPILQPFFHFMFITNESEDEEKVNTLEKNFLRFLQRRKLSDGSLRARIATQRRELLIQS